jgi:hypothetical protein
MEDGKGADRNDATRVAVGWMGVNTVEEEEVEHGDAIVVAVAAVCEVGGTRGRNAVDEDDENNIVVEASENFVVIAIAEFGQVVGCVDAVGVAAAVVAVAVVVVIAEVEHALGPVERESIDGGGGSVGVVGRCQRKMSICILPIRA